MSRAKSQQNQHGCDYHVRNLKFYEQRCAYHANQIITNFCKAEECLLPVCPTCIKLHSDEHQLHRTVPAFQDIAKVVAEIEAVYSKLDGLAQRIKQLLGDIEADKKQNEAKMRQKLIEHRNALVKEFEKALIAAQQALIETIVNDDQLFIEEIQRVDEQLGKLQSNLRKDGQLLHSDEVLKHIIIYYSKRNGEAYQRELEQLKRRGQDLVKKSMIVTVDEGELTTMSRAIARYMKIEISDWAKK